MKSFKKIAIGLLVVLAFILMICSYLFLSMSFHSSEAELKAELASIHADATIHNDLSTSRQLSYVRMPNPNKDAPILLTLHGAPGSCSDYSSFWSDELLTKKFEIISVDRPGYGGSYNAGANFSIAEQAEIISLLLTNNAPGRKLVILSHSYGGPIGVQLAAQLDTLCLGHVMVAPVLDPSSEEVFWYSPIPLIPPFSWISSTDWKTAAYEKKNHIAQLQSLTPYLKDVKSKTVHIHGTSDWLASIENIEFAKNNFNSAVYTPIVIEEGSHFILWEDEVKEMIIERLLRVAI